MTRQHRLVISLDEIRAIGWTCPACRATVSFNLAKTMKLPDRCPVCNDASLEDTDEGRRARAVAVEFVRSLRNAVGEPPKLLGLRLELETDVAV